MAVVFVDNFTDHQNKFVILASVVHFTSIAFMTLEYLSEFERVNIKKSSAKIPILFDELL